MMSENDFEKPNPDPAPGPVQPAEAPPTSADVARLARVSRATVSYVINNVQDARISEATKERVLQAAAQLGYIPHKIASSLRSGHSDLVLLPFFDWPYNESSITYLQEMAYELDEMGYTVMLRFFHRGEKNQLASKIAASHPIGVLVNADELTRADVELLTRNGVKAILAHRGTPTDYLPAVSLDFTLIGEMAAAHLASRGYTHLAVVVPRDERITLIGLERLTGIERVAIPRGLAVERVDLSFAKEEAAELAEKWARGPHPDAVFTYNDDYGGLLMSALLDVSLQVPRDLALVGCDNLPLCEMLRPRLTSIHLDPETSAHVVADYFHRMIQGEALEAPPVISQSCSLVVRESS